MVYDFRCDTCKEDFELTMKMSDDRSEVHCPICGNKAQRIFNVNFNKGSLVTWKPGIDIKGGDLEIIKNGNLHEV
jgi:putative FmdB family regulatory protein